MQTQLNNSPLDPEQPGASRSAAPPGAKPEQATLKVQAIPHAPPGATHPEQAAASSAPLRPPPLKRGRARAKRCSTNGGAAVPGPSSIRRWDVARRRECPTLKSFSAGRQDGGFGDRRAVRPGDQLAATTRWLPSCKRLLQSFAISYSSDVFRVDAGVAAELATPWQRTSPFARRPCSRGAPTEGTGAGAGAIRAPRPPRFDGAY